MIDLMPIFPEAYAYAMETPTREACGLIVVRDGKLELQRCRNIAADDHEFEIAPEDYITAAEVGIVAVFHSHLDDSPEPSMADLVGCERSQFPWLIIGLPSGTYKVVTPSDYVAPLLGRPYVYGLFDCYTLVQDYFAREGVKLPDFERPEGGWEGAAPLITLDNITQAGFEIVDDGNLQKGDVLIMQNGRTELPNHFAIYLGDDMMLHHAINQLSARVPYGGYYAKVTNWVVRRCHD